MNIRAENISNNQQVGNLFLKFLTGNRGIDSGTNGDNFSSLLENFSSNIKVNNSDNNVKQNDNLKDINSKVQQEETDFNEDSNLSCDDEDNNCKVRCTYQSNNNDKLKVKSDDSDEKIEDIAEKEDVQTIEDENEEKDNNNFDLTVNDELISTVVSLLESTKNFSKDELTKIKEVLQENDLNGSNISIDDFLSNLKGIMENMELTDLNVSEILNDVSDKLNELITNGELSLNFSDDMVVENVKSDNESTTNENEENSKNNLTSAFESVLNDILSSDLGDTSSENTEQFSLLNFQSNNLSNSSSNSINLDTHELLVTKFQNILENPHTENSSMMNLEMNFDNTQDFVKAFSVDGKNSVDVALKKEIAFKSLDSATSLRVLERVEEVLKAVSTSKDGSSISLRLDPPSLGEIKVDMTYKNGNLFARIIADSEDVENLLKSKVNELHQVLRESGIDVDNVNVFIGSRDSFDDKNNENSKNNLASNSKQLKVVKADDNSEIKEDLNVNNITTNITDSKWIA